MHDLNSLPADERPRERLLRAGPAALTDRELLAVILGTGAAGEDVLTQASRIMDRLGGRSGLVRTPAASLANLAGLGPGRATRLVAGLELGRRCLISDHQPGPEVRGPGDLLDLALAHLGGLSREVLGLFLLDVRLRVMGFRKISEGGPASTPASARAVFQAVLATPAAAVILIHNHPSGDPTPSPDDIHATTRLVAAGAALELPVLDHLILGGTHLFSMKDKKLM